MTRIDAALGGDTREGVAAAEAGAGSGWFNLFDQSQDFIVSGSTELFAFQWCGAGEEFVENDAERIDIRASIDIEVVMFGLFGTHVQRCADHDTMSREN